jgi:hypothetical protein
MNIFIPRSVAETSIPFLIKKVKKKFLNLGNINIITRPESQEIMKNISYVDNVLLINTKTFTKKSIINKKLPYNSNDIVIIPVSNISHIKSYQNVIDFMIKNFKKCKLYSYDFSKDNILEIKKKNFKLLSIIINSFTVLIFFPMLILFIFTSLIFLLKNNK